MPRRTPGLRRCKKRTLHTLFGSANRCGRLCTAPARTQSPACRSVKPATRTCSLAMGIGALLLCSCFQSQDPVINELDASPLLIACGPPAATSRSNRAARRAVADTWGPEATGAVATALAPAASAWPCMSDAVADDDGASAVDTLATRGGGGGVAPGDALSSVDGGTSSSAADSGSRRMTSPAPNSCTADNHGMQARQVSKRTATQPAAIRFWDDRPCQCRMLIACFTWTALGARGPTAARGQLWVTTISEHLRRFTRSIPPVSRRARARRGLPPTPPPCVCPARLRWGRAGEHAWQRRQGNASYQGPHAQQEIPKCCDGR